MASYIDMEAIIMGGMVSVRYLGTKSKRKEDVIQKYLKKITGPLSFIPEIKSIYVYTPGNTMDFHVYQEDGKDPDEMHKEVIKRMTKLIEIRNIRGATISTTKGKCDYKLQIKLNIFEKSILTEN